MSALVERIGRHVAHIHSHALQKGGRTLVGLRSVLTPLNLTSLRALDTFTGIPDDSARRQIARTLIIQHLPKVGGVTGEVGIPMGDIVARGQGFERPHSGGFIGIRDFDSGPQGFVTFRAVVRFVGFRCHEQSEGGPDEPYFIVGIQGANDRETVLKTFGPFDAGVETGDNVFLEDELTATVQAPFVIHVSALDHDSGSPEEASAKVEEGMKDAVALATAALTPLLGPVVLAVGGAVLSFLQIVGGTISDAASALLGMGDDLIGQNSVQLYDWDATKTEWRSPKDRTLKEFGDRPFNQEVVLANGEGGRYSAYFKVILFKIDPEPVPPEA